MVLSPYTIMQVSKADHPPWCLVSPRADVGHRLGHDGAEHVGIIRRGRVLEPRVAGGRRLGDTAIVLTDVPWRGQLSLVDPDWLGQHLHHLQHRRAPRRRGLRAEEGHLDEPDGLLIRVIPKVWINQFLELPCFIQLPSLLSMFRVRLIFLLA